MKILYSDHFPLPLPTGHRFPMRKYSLLREELERDSRFRECVFLAPPAATDEELWLAHCPEYVRRVIDGALNAKEVRRIGFPWSHQMVERSRRSVGATIETARYALEEGVSTSLAGGTHHAFFNRGEGFCVFNDVVVAARVVQQTGKVHQVLVVDCDVHQGNGTASMTQGDDSIFTFSIHGARNFPFRKEKSDLDIALEDGCQDDEYLSALEAGLEKAFRCDPQLVFYVSGADPYRGDRLGRLDLTRSGLRRRDEIVFDYCARNRTPVAVSMAGGYCPEIPAIVNIHLHTVAESRRLHGVWRKSFSESVEAAYGGANVEN